MNTRVIERFYAGRSTALDRVRVFAGKPPVPITRALGVLAGIGPKPKPLTLAGMRK